MAETVARAVPEALPGPGPGLWLRASAIAVLLAAVYYRTVATLWTTWTTNDNYSHGPLVPLVSAALLWRQRRRLVSIPVQPESRGLGLVGLACLLEVIGLRSDVFFLQGWSMLAMAFGIAWTLCGRRWLRVLAFPLGYLVFMLTFPPIVVNQLSLALKEITVRISTALADGLGVVFQRQGMVLYLSSGELRIENPCSGLRSLIALLATGAVFAYLQPGHVWRKLAMFLSAVPIAVLANAVRITALLVVAHYVGVDKATGAFHDLTGFLVYAVALVALLGMRAGLRPELRPWS